MGAFYPFSRNVSLCLFPRELLDRGSLAQHLENPRSRSRGLVLVGLVQHDRCSSHSLHSPAVLLYSLLQSAHARFDGHSTVVSRISHGQNHARSVSSISHRSECDDRPGDRRWRPPGGCLHSLDPLVSVRQRGSHSLSTTNRSSRRTAGHHSDSSSGRSDHSHPGIRQQHSTISVRSRAIGVRSNDSSY